MPSVANEKKLCELLSLFYQIYRIILLLVYLFIYLFIYLLFFLLFVQSNTSKFVRLIESQNSCNILPVTL